MFAKSFAAILDEKMQEDKQHRPSLYQDPAYLSFLIGNIAQTRVQSLNSLKSYQTHRNTESTKQNPHTEAPHTGETVDKTTQQQANPTPPPPLPPEPRKIHDFTVAQKRAQLHFAQAGQTLSQDFLERELKAAYRKLARKLHPDSCTESQYRTGEAFIELMKAHGELKKLFAN